MDNTPEYRFYRDLADWWPLISPPEEYVEESAYVALLLSRASILVRTVLELGSGGGHVAFHLKRQFELTLVDLSEQMLEVSHRLNPECIHVQGDMRTVRLDRLFDAVYVYDAIDYMTTESDLAQAIETAMVHCRPGGVALFVPDHITETFQEDTDHGGYDAHDGRGARYLEWTRDPDSNDTWIETDYAFLLREAAGATRVVHETHRVGLFSRDAWLRLLTQAGFEAEAIVEETSEERIPRELFLGRRPMPASG